MMYYADAGRHGVRYPVGERSDMRPGRLCGPGRTSRSGDLKGPFFAWGKEGQRTWVITRH